MGQSVHAKKITRKYKVRIFCSSTRFKGNLKLWPKAIFKKITKQ